MQINFYIFQNKFSTTRVTLRSLAASHYCWSREINCEFNEPSWIWLKCRSFQGNAIACFENIISMLHGSKWWLPCKLTLLMLETKYSSCVLLKSPVHQQAWYWLCRTDNMPWCFRLNLIYLSQEKSKIWFKLWIYLLQSLKQFSTLRVKADE